MNNIRKVHLFFEQSGTFKNEFIKFGIPAEDYDIQNNFGQTDHVIDLFSEIEKAYNGQASIFDNITEDDLIIAFFPCIYFCALSQIAFSFTYRNYSKLTVIEKTNKIIERSHNREIFFRLCIKMIGVSLDRGLRLILENPWSEQTFLKANFVAPPTFVDKDRTLRGDYYVKPTAYWFFNCKPTYGNSIQRNKNRKAIVSCKKGKQAGICSEERSLISPDYARNFISDFILGKEQNISQLNLF